MIHVSTDSRSVRLSPISGDGLLHPIALAAICLLVLNDHLLKAVFPGAITGKLSDVAGLIFVPLLLQAVWEIARAVVRRPSVGSRPALLASIAITAGAFTAIKTLAPMAGLYGSVAGGLQWLVGIVPTVALGAAFGPPHRVVLAVDPTDLIALPALALAYLIGASRTVKTPKPRNPQIAKRGLR